LQDMVHRADLPFQEGKWAESVKYFEALRVALPETAINYSKLCTAYENLGDLAKAEASCWTGLQYPGSKVITYYQYLRIAIAMLPETAAGDAQRVRLERIVQTLEHLKAAAPQVKNSMIAEEAALQEAGEKLEKGKPKDATAVPFEQQVELIACQLGVVQNDAERLEGCIEASKAMGTPRQALVPFEWARARIKGASAEEMNALLADAKRAGVPEAALTTLRASAGAGAAQEKRAAKYGAPLELALNGIAPAPEQPAAEAPASVAIAAAPVSSSTENWVVGFASVIGLGALGWWLRERGLRRGSPSQPATSNPGA
jgi:tetratricopeptide (TPR) repeat protein